MKRLVTLLTAGLLTAPAQALESRVFATSTNGSQLSAISSSETPESLVNGSLAGKKLGESAFLLRLVMTPKSPLRIAWLPPTIQNQTPLSQKQLQEIFLQLQKDLPDWIWQKSNLPDPTDATAPVAHPQAVPSESPALPETPTLKVPPVIPNPTTEPLPFNRQIMQLADQQKVDLVLGVRLISIQKGYWMLISLYSGADGSLLYNHKQAVQSLDTAELAKALIEDLRAIKQQPPVNDLGTVPGGELHLRSTPSGLHAYLDGSPVGLTPLILRQIPPGAHQLRLFEPDPYVIERIRIVSNPPGIMIRVNERELGRTPLDFPAEFMVPGRYEIDLSSESRDRFDAQIQVQTKPDNIPVQLNQLPVKRTPVTFQELSQNHYSLYLSPNRAIDLLLPLNLSTEELQIRQVDAYKYAKLIIKANINNVQVMLDNEVVGETPYSTNLAQGQHTVRLSKNRYRTQEQTLTLEPGKTISLPFELSPRSTDTSIFLTPTAELTPQLNIGAKYFTFGNLTRNSQPEMAHLYGTEVDYGWPELYRLAGTFDLGLELSGFLFALQTPTVLRSFQGLGAKLQFLRESDTIPISAALGTYLNLDLSRPKLVGYLSLSRNFGDFALHLGIQTHGFNLNVGYTGWENIRLGFMIYADSFWRLLSETDESTSTFYGLEAGYSF